MAQQILSTNTFTTAKWIVSATSSDGSHTTIASALTSASSGDTIFIRPGTYTENLTLKAGVNLTAFGSDASLNATGKVIISGTCTMTTAGTVTISGIQLQTNSAVFLAVTGTLASVVNLVNCYLNCLNNTGITFSVANTSAVISLYNCYGNLATTGIGLYANSSTGTLTIVQTVITNSGISTTASTMSAGTTVLKLSVFSIPFSVSSAAICNISFTEINNVPTNTTCMTTAGTGSYSWNEVVLASGTATPLVVGVGTTLTVSGLTLSSSNAAASTGTGTFIYSDIEFTSTAGTIAATPSARTTYLGGVSFDGGTNVLSTIPVPVNKGGTGAATLTGVLIGNGTSAVTASTVTQYGTVIAGTSNAVSSVAPSATSGVPYISQGAAANPVFGTAVVAGGGTGNVTQTAYSLVAGGTSTTAAFQAVGPNSSSNAILMAQGASALPAFLTNGTPYVTGISFDAGTTTLANYASSTWTPTIVGTVAGITTYTGQTGFYTRVGNLVTCQFQITLSAATGTGSAVLGGLPFTVKNQANGTFTGTILVSGAGWAFPVGTTYAICRVTPNTTGGDIFCLGTVTAGGALQMANAALTLQGCVTYQI